MRFSSMFILWSLLALLIACSGGDAEIDNRSDCRIRGNTCSLGFNCRMVAPIPINVFRQMRRIRMIRVAFDR